MSFDEKSFAKNHHTSDMVSTTVPSYISELLRTVSSAVDISKISVQMDSDQDSGWIWLIYGRSAYVWNFKSKGTVFFELPLPPSELIHTASLCHVFSSVDSGVRAIYVSPEGCVRFWMAVDSASSFTEFNVDSSGQVCHSVIRIKTAEQFPTFILATTTCDLFFISVDEEESDDKRVAAVPLKAPQNLLSNIGRRVSSLLFANGTTSSHDGLVNIIVSPEKNTADYGHIFLLNMKCQLQCWRIGTAGTDSVFWEIDLREKIFEKLSAETHRQLSENQLPATTKIYPIDCSFNTHHQLVILVAIIKPSSSTDYALLFFEERGQMTFETVKVVRLRLPVHYLTETEQLSNFRLLCPFTYDGVFIYDTKTLWFIDENRKDTVSLALPLSNHIFAAGIDSCQLLLFTKEEYLKAVKVVIDKNTSLLNLVDHKHEMYSSDKSDDDVRKLARSSDPNKRFKAAFIWFLRRKTDQSANILGSLFQPKQSSDIDALVVHLALDITDGYPIADPRWAKAAISRAHRRSKKAHNDDSGSLLLRSQLNNKRISLELFISFLKTSVLRDRISDCRLSDGRCMQTIIFLGELMEKLQACIEFSQKLDNLSDNSAAIFHSAMKSVLRERQEEIGSMLTAQDIFFRRVSDFDRLFTVLIDEEYSFIHERERPADDLAICDILITINEVLLAVFRSCVRCRETFTRTNNLKLDSISKTWLTADMMLQTFEKQLDEIFDYLEYPNSSIKHKLIQQAYELTDLLLFELRLRSDRKANDEVVESKFIEKFVASRCYEEAKALAEKSCNFRLLIEICDKCNDHVLLAEYKAKFRENGFVDYLNDYYIASGKPGNLFRGKTFDLLVADAENYLSRRNYLDLDWIYHLKTNNIADAVVDALKLSNLETNSMDKKKTLFGLTKLAAFSSDGGSESVEFKAANEGLMIIAHQQQLPSAIHQRPLSVEEVINAHISDPESDEWFFGRAADLMASVCASKMTKSDYDSFRTNLWATAILKDDWNAILENENDPLAAASHTLFNRTILLLCSLNKDNPDRFLLQLPAAESLLHNEKLKMLCQNAKFRYIIQAGDEKIRDWLNSNERQY